MTPAQKEQVKAMFMAQLHSVGYFDNAGGKIIITFPQVFNGEKRKIKATTIVEEMTHLTEKL
ncbi:MAG: hypothetical protein WCW14_00595 [Candidatus Paceibacterota bacterium]|jgi:hypothetical protein